MLLKASWWEVDRSGIVVLAGGAAVTQGFRYAGCADPSAARERLATLGLS